MNPVGCSVLAGGKNSRMGGINKAFLPINESTVLDLMINQLNTIFDEIIIVTNSPKEFDPLKKDCIIISDLVKNIGPLGGIYSALEATTKKSVFFFPCDMPYINGELIKKQIAVFNDIGCEAIVPVIGTGMEPLHSIFQTAVKERLYSFIKYGQDYYIRSFLDTIRVHYFDLELTDYHKKVFTNINSPEDLAEILNWNEVV